jgi:hypothetical protein
MTPGEILTAVRSQYNAVGDSFFGDTELYNLIWRAEQQLAMETLCIKDIATTTTVSGTREYSMPTTAIAIKRVTWNGRKLEPSDFMDDDVLTGYVEDTTETGTPMYYQRWDDSLFLRPTPNAASTLKIWYYAKPSQVTASTVLEIPEEYQLAIIDFMLHHMVSKDGLNTNLAAYHRANWEESVKKYRGWEQRKLRKDGAAAVKNLDAYSEVIGIR